MPTPALAKPNPTYFNLTHPHPYLAHVEINRPKRLNAFLQDMWYELRTIFDYLSVDPDTRAVILSGAGDRAFTTGLDVQAASSGGVLVQPEDGKPEDGARKMTEVRRYVYEFQDCVGAIEKCEKPVICVLHGYAYGLAIDIATCTDIRLCSSDTKLSVKEVDLGIAADIGTLTRLPKVVGSMSWVKDVCMSARIFGAEEAFRVGLVSEVLASKEEAIKKAVEIGKLLAGKSPVAVQGTKELLAYSADHSIADGLRYTAVWNGGALQTSEVPRAMQAGIQKRTPTFEKL